MISQEKLLELEVQELLRNTEKSIRKSKKHKKKIKKDKKKHKKNQKEKYKTSKSDEQIDTINLPCNPSNIQHTPDKTSPPKSHPQYPYKMLLKRVYELYNRDFPDKTMTKTHSRLVLPSLNVCRYKTTRTCWSNFINVCEIFVRPPEHLIQFIEYEIVARISINGRNNLIIPSRIDSRALSNILNRYAQTYVVCIRCKCPHTTFRKDHAKRVHYVKCSDCYAEYSVPIIKKYNKGHSALKRGDRYKLRAKT